MPETQFFPAFRHLLGPRGPRRAPLVSGLRQATLSQIEARLQPALPADLLRKPAAGDHSREKIFPLVRTFWCWVWQVLQGNTSCREVVRQVQALRALLQEPEIDAGNGAYCEARRKLPQALLEKAFAASARSAERRGQARAGLQGRAQLVVDGSGVHLSDTPKNRAAFPPTASLKKGCGFPYMRVVALFSLASGAILSRVTGTLRTAELTRFVQALLPTLPPTAILLADRAYGLYLLATLVRQRPADLIARLNDRSRRVDFRKAGKRLGPGDALFTWRKPGNASAMVSREDWRALPATLTVRVLRVHLDQPGFRCQRLTLMTTLLDPQLYPAAEILQAYARRWRMELCLRDLKSTLGMASLKCQSPAMAQKELLVFLSAHNFLRWIMAEAAQHHAVPLERISFHGSLDAFRQWTQALAQLGRARRQQRRRLWDLLLKNLAADLVPERPGRREPRAVKKRSKYPYLNQPRHQYRERWSRNQRRRHARKMASLI